MIVLTSSWIRSGVFQVDGCSVVEYIFLGRLSKVMGEKEVVSNIKSGDFQRFSKALKL
jgi:hypothetical protein